MKKDLISVLMGIYNIPSKEVLGGQVQKLTVLSTTLLLLYN